MVYETEGDNLRYIYILKSYYYCKEGELRTLMMHKEGWKVIARSGRVRTRRLLRSNVK